MSLTTEDGIYLGNVVESGVEVELGAVEIDGDEVDVAVLEVMAGDVIDEAGVVPVDAVLVPPQPATSPTARTVATSSPTSPDPRILFISIPPS